MPTPLLRRRQVPSHANGAIAGSRACFPSLWLDILRNAGQSTNDLLQKTLTGKLGDAFLVEFLATIAPNRVLKPDFSQEFFDNISATFNCSEIGIVFNSYQPGSCEGTPGPV